MVLNLFLMLHVSAYLPFFLSTIVPWSIKLWLISNYAKCADFKIIHKKRKWKCASSEIIQVLVLVNYVIRFRQKCDVTLMLKDFLVFDTIYHVLNLIPVQICTLYVLCAIYDTYIILVHRVIRYNTKHRELRSQDSCLCSDTFLWHLLHTCALSTLSPPSGSGTWTRILLAELLLPLETSLEGRGAGGRLEGAILGLGRWALPGRLAVDGRL